MATKWPKRIQSKEEKVGFVVPHEPIITVGLPVLYETIKAVAMTASIRLFCLGQQ